MRRTPTGLGIDFGTSHSVAVVKWPDGRTRPLLFDGSPLLPSCVFVDASGGLLVGMDARHSARQAPENFEPYPKRRIDDGVVLLGDRELPVPALVAAVLRRIAAEATRTLGEPPGAVTLTCPATWGGTRRALLVEAAADAGLGQVQLIAEPVAAARYFTTVLGHELPVGTGVVVYDLGAGTFDASVVRRTETGLEAVVVAGLDDLGGLDLDAAVIDHLERHAANRDAARHAAVWPTLRAPATPGDRRDSRLLWDDARAAKELLSRATSTVVHVPRLDMDVMVSRTELEDFARPLLDRTVAVTVDVVRRSGLADATLAGVFLVGGSSRIPLVATLLHRALGRPPTVIEQPELVVAEGSVTDVQVAADEATAAAPPLPPVPPGAPPPEIWPDVAEPDRAPRATTPLWVLVAVLAVVFALTSAVAGVAVVRRSAAASAQSTAVPPLPEYATAAQDAAKQHLPVLFSYDHRSFDEGLAKALARTTGTFRSEYETSMRGLRDEAERQQATLRAEVVRLGVVSASPDRVVILAFLNQRRSNSSTTGEKLDQGRVEVTLVPVKGKWLVSEVKTR